MKNMKKLPQIGAAAGTMITVTGSVDKKPLTQDMIATANWTHGDGTDPVSGEEVHSLHGATIGGHFSISDGNGSFSAFDKKELRVVLLKCADEIGLDIKPKANDLS